MVRLDDLAAGLGSSNCADAVKLLKGRNLIAHAVADIRLAMSRAVALETTRCWKIAKEKQSHKIDVVSLSHRAQGGPCQRDC